MAVKMNPASAGARWKNDPSNTATCKNGIKVYKPVKELNEMYW